MDIMPGDIGIEGVRWGFMERYLGAAAEYVSRMEEERKRGDVGRVIWARSEIHTKGVILVW